MKYKEFKQASKKHLETCKCLLAQIENGNCELSQQHLKNNLFYLSGYIVETILKYMIYVAIGYDRDKNITELKDDGLRYDKDIKIHSLVKLEKVLQSKYSADTFFTHSELSKWNVEYRYKKDVDVDLEFVRKFTNKAQKLYESFYKN